MREYEMIAKIICDMDDDFFEELNDYYWYSVIGGTSKDKAIFKKMLNKVGITLAEWELWNDTDNI